MTEAHAANIRLLGAELCGQASESSCSSVFSSLPRSCPAVDMRHRMTQAPDLPFEPRTCRCAGLYLAWLYCLSRLRWSVSCWLGAEEQGLGVSDRRWKQRPPKPLSRLPCLVCNIVPENLQSPKSLSLVEECFCPASVVHSQTAVDCRTGRHGTFQTCRSGRRRRSESCTLDMAPARYQQGQTPERGVYIEPARELSIANGCRDGRHLTNCVTRC